MKTVGIIKMGQDTSWLVAMPIFAEAKIITEEWGMIPACAERSLDTERRD